MSANNLEIHLFIIWNNAYYELNEIISDISINFNILKQIEIIWSKDKFSENLTQFYGINLPNNSGKDPKRNNIKPINTTI